RVCRGLALLAAALLVGCSGEQGAAPDGAVPPPTPTGEATAEPTTEASPTAEAPAATEPTPDATGAATAEVLADVAVAVEEVAQLEAPTAMAIRRGDDALYVAERGGRVQVLRGGEVAGEPLLDISDEVTVDGERGLLGIDFSDDGETLYVSSTDLDGNSRLDAYAMEGDALEAGSRRNLLQVDQPFSNHNGGNVVVGPDGLLYYGLGDGGSGGDPHGNGQDPSTLLGAMLRIDPERGDPYAVPDDNPFPDSDGGRPEVFVYGLRNPWRFSFDRRTNDLWIGDVGQGEIEEIDRLPAGEGAGANLGWNRFEGTQPFAGGGDRDGLTFPVAEYRHTEGRCSITGGYVYRGDAIPGLGGAYLYTDFCGGQLEALRLEGGEVADQAQLPVSVEQAVSFGEDAEGELYLLSLSGPVYRLVPAD
ncbi:MAG: PQQ-dependent sugar dehydrogenase, partial [Egibacteraceae bacterium]